LRDKKSKKNIRKKYIAKISVENFISKIKNLYTNDWFYIFVTYFATPALESTIDLYWNMQALKGIILKLII